MYCCLIRKIDVLMILYLKMKNIFFSMLDKTIFHMCELLDIRKGDKQSNIINILDFLLKPYTKIDPATDPLWQPVVHLERIAIGKIFVVIDLSFVS